MVDFKKALQDITDKKDYDSIWDVVSKVADMCDIGPIKWVARQIADNRWSDDYGFVIGDKFASVSIQEARNHDDNLIRKLAAEILGYPVGSIDDLNHRKSVIEELIAKTNDEIKHLETKRQFLEYELREINDGIVNLSTFDQMPEE